VTKPSQYILPLPHRVSLDRDDYFVSASNRSALNWVERWPDWPQGMLAIVGPQGAGKTHLARVHEARAKLAERPVSHMLSDQANDLLIEDVELIVGDPLREEAIFHAFNRALLNNGSILFSSRTPLPGLPVTLADLRTRLNTVTVVELPAPDDALLMAVLLKLFADRQIDPERSAAVAAWAVPRMARSLAAAADFVDALDRRSLSDKRRLDTRLAAEILSPELDL
jgi:chromosomal replication initiation ATPase DnaA